MSRRYDKYRQALEKGETQRKDGVYVFRRIDSIQGLNCLLYATSLADLRAKERQLQRDIEDGISVNAAQANMTLNELFARYLSIKKIEETTRASYLKTWDLYVRNTLGPFKLSSIKSSDVKMLYAKMNEATYAHGTLGNIQTVLYPTLEMAVDDDIIRKNPAKGALGNYGRPAKVKEPLTAQQEERLLNFVKGSKIFNVHYPLLIVMLWTGLRCGEVLGLTWEDVDLKAKEISVKRQLVYKKLGDNKVENCFKIHIKKPKTPAGVRVFPMLPIVCAAFEQQKVYNALRDVNSKVMLDGYSGFIFVTANGSPMLPSQLNEILAEMIVTYNKKELKAAEKEKRKPELLPHISSHYCRHTFGTRLNEYNVNAKAIQTALGHENIQTTLNVYVHVNKENLKAEFAKVDDTKPVDNSDDKYEHPEAGVVYVKESVPEFCASFVQ